MFNGAIKRAGADVFLDSPPDVFAVCAKIAKVTGCYLDFASESKLHLARVADGRKDGVVWANSISSLPLVFRLKIIPRQIVVCWRYVCARLEEVDGSDEVLDVDDDLTFSILYLISAADSACAGLGILDPGIRHTYFGFISSASLAEKGTLCQILGSRYGRVLPKRHTPKVGLNLRNLTRHVSYSEESEVSVNWNIRPIKSGKADSSFNLLIIPWPFEVLPVSITDSGRSSSTQNVGYFKYSPKEPVGAAKKILDLFNSAKNKHDRVDLVVFPECSLSEDLWKNISSEICRGGSAVLAGVYGRDVSGCSTNSVRLKTREIFDDEVVQYKHHRWKLESSQICNYSLGGTLSCSKEWWEDIKIFKREINFFSFSKDLVVAPLICEDLARQDPVADLVRSVGPNLVIALLMDGPQLPNRWSSRYASVLADDPGSSVLTVSSLGMVNLSSPPPGKLAKKTIASWKQQGGDFNEVCLEGDSRAALLNLQFKQDYEQTVDGLKVDSYSSIPVLAGVHYVK